MALITVDELLPALRLQADDADFRAIVTRHLASSRVIVRRYAPGAPEAVCNEAIERLVGRMVDNPFPVGGDANVFRNSGAQALLAPWRVHRAGKVG